MLEQDAHVASSDVPGGLYKPRCSFAVYCLLTRRANLGMLNTATAITTLLSPLPQDGHNGNSQDKSREGQQHIADAHDGESTMPP